jgi:thiomorpholine-carboxylate dehydrogenase
MRTAAVSAVAVEHLASKDAKVLAVLGSGVQARSHLRALSVVRKFDEVRVWSRSPGHARVFAEEAGAQVFASAEEAVRGADVVLTLTSAAEPILFGKWLKKSAMVCAIGAVTPERRELDSDTMRGSVVVESREAGMREPGDILLARAQIAAEIGELLNGATLDPRSLPVVFKSVGIAVEDIAAARLVYEKTIARA